MIEIDFSAWSPSHIILVTITLLAFGGQLIAIISRLNATQRQLAATQKQLTERMDKQAAEFHHALERLEERMDKRITEVNQQIIFVREEISHLNQNHIEHLTHHN